MGLFFHPVLMTKHKAPGEGSHPWEACPELGFTPDTDNVQVHPCSWNNSSMAFPCLALVLCFWLKRTHMHMDTQIPFLHHHGLCSQHSGAWEPRPSRQPLASMPAALGLLHGDGCSSESSLGTHCSPISCFLSGHPHSCPGRWVEGEGVPAWPAPGLP